MNHDAKNRLRRPVVYIAGPYRAPTPWGIEQNVRRAETAALAVWKSGAVALCPHLNTRHFQHELPDERWLEGDLDLLERCDAVLFIEGWLNSEGSKVEHAYAEHIGLPVFGIGHLEDGTLHTWVHAPGSAGVPAGNRRHPPRVGALLHPGAQDPTHGGRNGSHEERSEFCNQCGAVCGWVPCKTCDGEGFVGHDCGEDTCCCADPEMNVRCDVCLGSCRQWACLECWESWESTA